MEGMGFGLNMFTRKLRVKAQQQTSGVQHALTHTPKEPCEHLPPPPPPSFMLFSVHASTMSKLPKEMSPFSETAAKMGQSSVIYYYRNWHCLTHLITALLA